VTAPERPAPERHDPGTEAAIAAPITDLMARLNEDPQ
jgi:hypothetical protein